MTELDNFPLWVRVITWIGLPSAIACALTWFLMSIVYGNVLKAANNTATALVNHTIIIENQKDILLLEDKLREDNIMIEKYLLAMCLNYSKSIIQAARCEQVR